MNSRKFLFLSNVITNNGNLDRLKEELKNQFDFVVHSENKEVESSFDLRNFKMINSRMNKDAILILYLTRELSLFVIKQFIRLDENKNRRIYFISSLPTKYFPHNHASFLTQQKCKNMLNLFFPNSVFVDSILLEDNFIKRLRDFNILSENQSYLLAIPVHNVIREIVSRENNLSLAEKQYIVLNDGFENTSSEDFLLIKKEASRQIYKPFFFLSNKENRIYLRALLSVLEVIFDSNATTYVKPSSDRTAENILQ